MHNDKHYILYVLKHHDNEYYCVVDAEDYKIIEQVSPHWHLNKNNNIYTQHQTGSGKIRDIYIQELIMHKYKLNTGMDNKHINHINKINYDNRKENLQYDTQNKLITRNTIKRHRSIVLPDGCGIDPQDIPTYVWYLKPDKSHGDRFVVQINGNKWKTSSSKTLTLRYKLEEAKKYIRILRETQPEIFEANTMNGELNQTGRKLLESYYEILHIGGIDIQHNDNHTHSDLLRQSLHGLTTKERNMLKSLTFDIDSISDDSDDSDVIE